MRRLAALFVLLVATAAHAPAEHASTVAFEIEERDLFPESVAFDPSERSFYVGSMYKRKIVKVDREGRASDFVAPKRDGLWEVLGMKIDVRRRELWANTCNLGEGQRPPMIDPDPSTAGRAAVMRYDLENGALLRRYEPKDPPPQLCFNDLVLADGGDVYLSSGPTGVWRISSGSDVVELFSAADGMFGNGIALSADGRTLYLAVHDKGIAAIDVATKSSRVLSVPEGPHVMGIDGLYVHDGALVGIQNGTKTHRIVRAVLSADGAAIERVEVLDEAHPRFAVPTTGVFVDHTLFYVATSQLDSIDPQTNTIVVESLVPNVILRLDVGTPDAPAHPPSPTRSAGCANR